MGNPLNLIAVGIAAAILVAMPSTRINAQTATGPIAQEGPVFTLCRPANWEGSVVIEWICPEGTKFIRPESGLWNLGKIREAKSGEGICVWKNSVWLCPELPKR